MKFTVVFLCASCVPAWAQSVDIAAGADIQAAVDANPPGTVFHLAAGVYRMQSVVPKDGDTFIGALDAAGDRASVMSGAQQLTEFIRDEFGNYVAVTTQTQSGEPIGYCAAGFPRCNLPEDLFYDNEPYRHVSVGGAALQPGQYFFDYPNGRIYFRPLKESDDPAQHVVEYARVPLAIQGKALNVTVTNVVVEKYASPDQYGAIGGQFPGEGWVLENNETRMNHGTGMRVGTNGQLLYNYTHNNGQLGMGGTGSNITVRGNEIAWNNYSGTDHDFECGGFKFAKTDGLTVRNNYSHDNLGPGMWTDVSSINVLYENNLVMNNARSGIFHETSYDAVIRNNVLLNNGSVAPDDWFWNSAVQLAASQNVEVYNNTVWVSSFNNGNGIMLIQQNRSGEPCLYGPCRVINNYVHDNVVVVTGNRWHGSSGGVQDYAGQGDMFAPEANNRFVSNHYYVTDLKSTVYWQWAGEYVTYRQFTGFGLETHGTLSPNFTGEQ
jgi:parallel beta-helix repeat protein